MLYSVLTFLSLIGSVYTLPSAASSPSSDRTARVLARHEPGLNNNPKSKLYETRFPNVTWDQDNWELSTTLLDQAHFQSRIPIANGYLGINVAAAGPFFEVDEPVNGDVVDEWPIFQRRQTFATVGGFFDSHPTTEKSNFGWLNQYGGESIISGIPHWSGLVVELSDGSYLDASVEKSTLSGFRSSFDYKGGIFTWEYTWTPRDVSFAIQYRLFAHKLNVNQAAVQLQITPSADSQVTIANVLDGTAAVRTDFVTKGRNASAGAVYSAVRSNGINNVTAYLYAGIQASNEFKNSTASLLQNKPYVGANESSIAEGVTARLTAKTTATITKYVGGASSDGFANPQEVAKNAFTAARKSGFESLLKSHIAEWSVVFPDDSVDDYSFPENRTLPDDPNIIESAIHAVANSYYLLQNTIGDNALATVNNAPIDSNSISVGGLTSDTYGGLIFWDAEVWMQPGLVASFPSAVKTIANYRTNRYGQALANAQTSYVSSKNATRFSSNAAAFPWTSGRFGNCTGTGPCFDYEYHIGGDIALSFRNYWAVTGDTEFFKESLFPVHDSIATFYSELVTKNGSVYELTNMTDPDEFANHVDNGGYTMPLIATTLNTTNWFRELLGLEQNETFTDIADHILVGRDPNSDITLEYTGMNGSISVKQADVVLNSFPLEYTQNYTSKNALIDMEYYANKQSPDGPGMTFAIFSIVANTIAPSGCSAYTYDLYTTQPYTRGPWFQFSEQLLDDYSINGGFHPAFPFLTGHGGANQVALLGYLGLRLTSSFTLSINPNLPPQIPHLKYRTFFWQGWPITAQSNYTHTTITRLSDALPTANQTFANAPIVVHVGPADNFTSYSLPTKGTITVPNRQVASIKTVPGNIAQCAPKVTTNSPYEPGQFPLAAVDGADTTKWQPAQANTSSRITVSLSPETYYTRISSLFFDWASAPPLNATVYFHNSTSSGFATDAQTHRFTIAPVNVSAPYNAASAATITPYTGNTTSVTLPDGFWSGRYATLEIIGSHALENPLNGTGAIVAEWGIIADGKSLRV
ncbi:hypothetical protein MW887_004760 [Aspergillus wentii]|nr:hypothetical protein MW887_004760 [Aspergillus wentii]